MLVMLLGASEICANSVYVKAEAQVPEVVKEDVKINKETLEKAEEFIVKKEGVYLLWLY